MTRRKAIALALLAAGVAMAADKAEEEQPKVLHLRSKAAPPRHKKHVGKKTPTYDPSRYSNSALPVHTTGPLVGTMFLHFPGSAGDSVTEWARKLHSPFKKTPRYHMPGVSVSSGRLRASHNANAGCQARPRTPCLATSCARWASASRPDEPCLPARRPRTGCRSGRNS